MNQVLHKHRKHVSVVAFVVPAKKTTHLLSHQNVQLDVAEFGISICIASVAVRNCHKVQMKGKKFSVILSKKLQD